MKDRSSYPVLTLRNALSRARRLGASVSNVKATGEVRVISGGTRLTMNARRKDAPSTLTRLLADLEAAAPEKAAEKPATKTLAEIRAETRAGAEPITERPVTIAERIRRHIETTVPPDADGWHAWSGAAAIAEELGVKPIQVSTYVSDGIRRGIIEARRTNPNAGRGGHYDALRFERQPHQEPQMPRSVTSQQRLAEHQAEQPPLPLDYRDQPIRVVGDPLSGPLRRTDEPRLGQLAVPKLEAYAQTHKAIHDLPLAKIELSESDVAEILRDARRLYWYMKSGGKIEDPS